MKNTKISFSIISGAILISIILVYLYSQMVIVSPQDKFIKYNNMIYLQDNDSQLSIDLVKDSYFFRLKHKIQKNQSRLIFVNGVSVDSNMSYRVRKKGAIQSIYAYLPKKIIKDGVNRVDINFLKSRPDDLDIMLTNYRRKISNDIYILFSDSEHSPTGKVPAYAIVIITGLVFILFIGIPYLISKITFLNINQLFFLQVYSISPFIIFLSGACIFSAINGHFRVVFTQAYFLDLSLAIFFIVEVFIILLKVGAGIKKKIILSMESQIPFKSQLAVNSRISSSSRFFSNIYLKFFNGWLVQWIGTREFSDKCIILFAVLLMICPILLVAHLDTVAEQFSNFAFFLMAVVLIAKTVKIIREERGVE